MYVCRANPQTKGVHAASSVETGKEGVLGKEL